MARGGSALAAAAALSALALVACSQTGPETGSGPQPGPAATAPTGATSSRSPNRPRDVPDQPLVLAVHHTSPLHDVTLRRARRIAAQATRPEVAAGAPRSALRAVVRDPMLVAVVPAAAVGPQVRTLRVEGVDPMRRPAAYRLRTSATAEQQSVTTLTVVGDIMLGRGVARAARGSTDPAPALRPMAARLAAADITVGNLENTLSQAGAPRQGGDSFAADPRVVRSLRAAGFDVLSLANNHVGDFGSRSLVQTVRRLRAGDLATFGAGADAQQARTPAVVERDGARFGFVGFNAIGETPTAGPAQPGAVSVGMPPRTGPLDVAALQRFERAVRRLDRAVDVVVAMPHWGTQYTNRPEPVQRLVARRLVRAGADVVVGGHPHWLQGMEMVRGRLVAHSLGNFVFDMDFMRRTMEGAVLELTFWGSELKAVELVPYVMDAEYAPRVVTGARATSVLETLRETSGAAFKEP